MKFLEYILFINIFFRVVKSNNKVHKIHECSKIVVKNRLLKYISNPNVLYFTFEILINKNSVTYQKN